MSEPETPRLAKLLRRLALRELGGDQPAEQPRAARAGVGEKAVAAELAQGEPAQQLRESRRLGLAHPSS